MTAALSRIDTTRIYPPLLRRVEVVLERLGRRGVFYVATRGWASAEIQNELYAQGRTRPGLVVTNAKGWLSQHNYGLAVDFVCDIDGVRPGVQPSWDQASYEPLASEVLRAGLHTGSGYKDWPHVGWPSFIGGPELSVLGHLWRTTAGAEIDKLHAVWKYVDAQRLRLPNY